MWKLSKFATSDSYFYIRNIIKLHHRSGGHPWTIRCITYICYWLKWNQTYIVITSMHRWILNSSTCLLNCVWLNSASIISSVQNYLRLCVLLLRVKGSCLSLLSWMVRFSFKQGRRLGEFAKQQLLFILNYSHKRNAVI